MGLKKRLCAKGCLLGMFGGAPWLRWFLRYKQRDGGKTHIGSHILGQSHAGIMEGCLML